MSNLMTSYAFHELTPRAQDLAIDRYISDPIIHEIQRWQGLGIYDTLLNLDWRFTEHGERVA